MGQSLKILHCLRAPVGGLFRHVLDLATEQAARGHKVGIIADQTTGDDLTLQRFASIEPHLALGLHRIAMSRKPGIGDIAAARATALLARKLSVDILHGHGAKGGAFARLAAARLRVAERQPVACFYTPHGGTLHYSARSAEGQFYFWVERLLAKITDGIIFESAYSQRVYDEKIGLRGRPSAVVPNGLLENDFRVVSPNSDAAHFLFVGELRHLKGVDVLLDALAELNRSAPVSAVIVGSGPDADLFKAKAGALGLSQRVSFPGTMPAREAFKLGRVVVVPSRAESFPYIVLEAAAAGLPILASNVGGIPEIVAATDTELIPPDDVGALASRMQDALAHPEIAAGKAARLHASVRERFTTAQMSARILDFYRAATDHH